MLQNADVFESDAIILDLEDAVYVGEKDSARTLVSLFLDSHINHDLEIIIRVNGVDTPYFKDDLIAVISEKIDSIMLPKARIADIKFCQEMISKLEVSRNIKKKIGIIPIIELSASILEIDEIAKCDRVTGILLGAEDLSTDLGIERTKNGQEILFPRFKVIYACTANNIDAIDTPFTDTKDEEGLRLDCDVAKSLGMKAKAAIHPNQVEIINECFSPNKKSIEWAQRILEAKKRAEQNGLGVFSLDGKMVDKPIISRALNIIDQAIKYRLL
jgi:citrate lyase subunit beta/citryl-CoA lyase